MKQDRLDILYHKKGELQKLIKYAKLLGGKVHIGNNDISVQLLRKTLSSVNAEISAIISNGKLEVINPNKKEL